MAKVILVFVLTFLLITLECVHCSLNVHCRTVERGSVSCQSVVADASSELKQQLTSTQPNYKLHVHAADPLKVVNLEFDESGDVIEEIPVEISVTFPNLYAVTIANTYVNQLKSNDFAQALNLRELDLHGNRIKIIRSGVFSAVQSLDTGVNNRTLQQLNDLKLHANEIAEIDDFAFSGLIKLQTLDLLNNKLSVIRRQTFAGLPSLATLHLSMNQIAIIEDDALALPNLKVLSLDDNKLKRLSDNIFTHLHKIESIGLAENELQHIGRAFDELTAVVVISLKRNQINDINLNQFARLTNFRSISM